MTSTTSSARDLTALASVVGIGGTIPRMVDPHPTALDRWQPTRSGVVNSWQWENEQFLHHAGSLALIGKNGSGKSLTGSTFFPTLWDGEVSEKSLSISGQAIGTLTERHTGARAAGPRTGMWWQEYGRVDTADTAAAEQDTQWLTIGLWLRKPASEKSSVERAWFIVPARVDRDIVLERNRVPVDIADLAGQLATHGGRLFTSVNALRAAAGIQLPAVEEEHRYPTALREAMLSPLSQDQVTALTTVLRTLRGVRVTGKIGYTFMQNMLSEALPGLDSERVKQLAENLTKTSQIETRLNAKRAEGEELGKLVSAYRRYAGAQASYCAAQLIHDIREFEGATTAREELNGARTAQSTAKQVAEAAAEALREELAQCAASIAALQDQLRDHPGAGIEHLATVASERESIAENASQHSEAASQQEQATRATAGRDSHTAASASLSLAELFTTLAGHAEAIGALAHHESLCALCAPLLSSPPVSVANLSAHLGDFTTTRRTWVGKRTQALAQVQSALAAHTAARQARDDAEEHLAKLDEDANSLEETAAAAREEADDQCSRAIAGLDEFTASIRHLVQHPDELAWERPLDVPAIIRWADQALAATLARLDAPGNAQREREAEQAAHQCAQRESQARENTAAARRDLSRKTAALTSCTSRLTNTPTLLAQLIEAAGSIEQSTPGPLPGIESAVEDTSTRVHEQIGALETQLRAARTLLSDAARDRDAAEEIAGNARDAERRATSAHETAEQTAAAAHTAMTTWIDALDTWLESLVILDRTTLHPHQPPSEDAFDPASWRSRLVTSHRAAAARISAQRAHAESLMAGLESQRHKLIAEITDAERAAPVPEAPTWRPNRADSEGAPLWAAVDFAPDLPESQRGLVEGALLTAGLLDAWISTEGKLTRGDLHLVPGRPLTGPSLADVLIVDPDSPIDPGLVRAVLACVQLDDLTAESTSPATLSAEGTLRTGILLGAAPDGWEPTYIGHAARKRARQARLSSLRTRLDELDSQIAAAGSRIENTHAHEAEAELEAGRFPPSGQADDLRAQAANDLHEATRLDEQAALQAGKAAEAQTTAQASNAAAAIACASLRLPPDTAAIDEELAVTHALPGVISILVPAIHRTVTTLRAQDQATTEAAERRELHAQAAERARMANAASEQARRERAMLPEAKLTQADLALHAAKSAERNAQQAASLVTAARGEVRRHETRVHEALRKLNTSARTQSGEYLPTSDDAIREHAQRVEAYSAAFEDTVRAATRVDNLAETAQRATALAEQAADQAERARAEAQRTGREARAARHHHAERVRVHGHDFEELSSELAGKSKEREQLDAGINQRTRQAHDAEIELTRIDERLKGAQSRCDIASANQDLSLAALQSLFDQDLITDVAGGDALHRPEDPQTGMDTAKRIIAGRAVPQGDPAKTLEAAKLAVDLELKRLGTQQRNGTEALLRLGRAIELVEVPGLPWMQVIVKASASATDLADAAVESKPLRDAVDDVRTAVASLEADFTTQLQDAVKGYVFTDLRKHIVRRIALAQKIVEDIGTILGRFRTDVGKVGIALSWVPRKDAEAAEARALIQSPNIDGNLDRMYEFFVKQLNDETGAGGYAEERIQRVFDYRSWYEWEIQLTHTRFAAPGDTHEVFKKVTLRSNPFDALSTGEQRLVTMLPLLAAVRAFYSAAGYRGPRMIFLDELNAAFDEENLRKILELIRTWDLDLIATLPAINPILNSATGSIAIHRICTQDESTRYSIPALWDGRGTAQTARIAVSRQSAASEPEATPGPEEPAAS